MKFFYKYYHIQITRLRKKCYLVLFFLELLLVLYLFLLRIQRKFYSIR